MNATVTPTAAPAGLLEQLRPRGLGWLAWRQHRWLGRLLLAAVLLLALAAPFMRSAMAAYIDSHQIAGCAEISLNPLCQGQAHQQAVMEFRSTWGELLKLLGLLLVLLPAGLGVFVGAPLFAREFESGTWKLVLAQSVSPARWIRAKLLTVGLVAAAGSAALMALFHWLWQPSANDVSGISWYSRVFVVSGGPLLIATVLLALAVGATVGAMVGRVVPAMAVTTATVAALQVGLASLRPYLWGWHTELLPESELPNSVWGFAQGSMRADGTRLYDSFPGGDAREFSDVHGAADYWPLQLVECGVCLALTAVVVAVLLRWTARKLG